LGALGLRRQLYNTALEHRIIAYLRRRVSVSGYQQEAELKDIRAAITGKLIHLRLERRGSLAFFCEHHDSGGRGENVKQPPTARYSDFVLMRYDEAQSVTVL